MRNPLLLATPAQVSRFLALGLCVIAVTLASGCGSGGKESKNSVSGKVLLDGKAVEGTVVFVTSDNKEFSSPIAVADGMYQVNDVPNGTAKIYIKGSLAGIAKEAPKAAGGAEMPKMGDKGVPAPAKYSSANSSGLSVEVKGGKQVHDITLTP